MTGRCLIAWIFLQLPHHLLVGQGREPLAQVETARALVVRRDLQPQPGNALRQVLLQILQERAAKAAPPKIRRDIQLLDPNDLSAASAENVRASSA